MGELTTQYVKCDYDNIFTQHKWRKWIGGCELRYDIRDLFVVWHDGNSRYC